MWLLMKLVKNGKLNGLSDNIFLRRENSVRSVNRREDSEKHEEGELRELVEYIAFKLSEPK